MKLPARNARRIRRTLNIYQSVDITNVKYNVEEFQKSCFCIQKCVKRIMCKYYINTVYVTETFKHDKHRPQNMNKENVRIITCQVFSSKIIIVFYNNIRAANFLKFNCDL